MRNNTIWEAFKKNFAKVSDFEKFQVFLIKKTIYYSISFLICRNKSSIFNALSGFCKKVSLLEDLSCSNQIGINLTLFNELPYKCVRVIDSLIPGFRESILYFFYFGGETCRI